MKKGNTITINGNTITGIGTLGASSSFNQSFQKGIDLAQYLDIGKPKHLYRSNYQGNSWLRTASHLETYSTTEQGNQYVCSGDPVKLLEFVIDMSSRYGMNLPPAKELEFLWNVFNSTADER